MSLHTMDVDRAYEQTIVISRTDKIGDFVVSIPAYATAKAMFPKARIVALTSHFNKELAKALPSVIDDVLCVDDFVSEKDLFTALRSLNPDIFVALKVDHLVMRLASKCGAKRRIGPYSKFWSFVCFNNGLKQSRSKCIKSEAEYNLDLIRHIDPERYDRVGERFARLEYTTSDREQAMEYLQQAGLTPQNFVLVNPFTGGSGANLSIKQYAEVITGIMCGMCERGYQMPMKFGVLALPQHVDQIAAMIANIEAPLRSFVRTILNEHSLMVAAAIVDQCKFFIGPSTGITQIAGNYQKPCMCFYSSRPSNSYTRWQLYGDQLEFPVTFDRNLLDESSHVLMELSAEFKTDIVRAALSRII